MDDDSQATTATDLALESFAHETVCREREAVDRAVDAHTYREMAQVLMRTAAEQRAEIRKLRYRLRDQAEQIRALMGIVS